MMDFMVRYLLFPLYALPHLASVSGAKTIGKCPASLLYSYSWSICSVWLFKALDLPVDPRSSPFF